MSKLAAALRAKFGTPKRVIEALPLDPSLLDDARKEALLLAQDAARGLTHDGQDVTWRGSSPTLRNEAVEEGERLAARAKDGERMDGGMIARVLRIMKDAGCDDQMIQKVSYAMNGEAEDDLTQRDREELNRTEKTPAVSLDDIAGFLKSRGLSGDEIEEAFRLGGVDRRRATDTLPNNALSGAGTMGRGGGFGGRMSERMAGDRMAFDAHKLTQHITVDNFGARNHYRPRPAPTSRQVEKTFAKYPGMRNIRIG